MKLDIILAGVGGQGILSIAFVLDNAALKKGYNVKQAEVHGMAQRGGAVQSHMRISDEEIYSDLIPRGGADMILSVEPLEALRYREYLAPDGVVVTSSVPEINIPDYPDAGEVLDKVYTFPRHVVVDSARLARAAGSVRAQNMVMVGAASPYLDLDNADMLEYIEALFSRKGEKIVKVNHRAFRLGAAAGGFFQGLVNGGMSSSDSFAVTSRTTPESMAEVSVSGWIDAFKRDAAGVRAGLDALEAGESVDSPSGLS